MCVVDGWIPTGDQVGRINWTLSWGDGIDTACGGTLKHDQLLTMEDVAELGVCVCVFFSFLLDACGVNWVGSAVGHVYAGENARGGSRD